MRKLFGELLAETMKDERVRLLAGDVGFGVLDAAFKAAPDRAWNMGAAEQAMIGAAVGMTYEGKIPICYTITPFLLYRPFEWLRNYCQIEHAPIKLVGVGRRDDYKSLGYTHWCFEQIGVLEVLPRIQTWFPDTEDDLRKMWPYFMAAEVPVYLNLRRV